MRGTELWWIHSDDAYQGWCFADPLLIWTHPKDDNPHTIYVKYVSSFQYGTDSVCKLLYIGGVSRLKLDQRLNTILEMYCMCMVNSERKYDMKKVAYEILEIL